jgi:HSP20 family protein
MSWRSKQGATGPEAASPLRALRAEIERLLDAYVREPFSSVEWPLMGQRNWMPAVDIAENDTEVIVRAELAGVKPEDLEVNVSGNYLVLAGEKKDSLEGTGRNYLQLENRFGGFRRTIPLPQSVAPENVEAELDSGVLTVRLQKTPSTQAKRVAVKVKEEPHRSSPPPGEG